MPSVRSGTAAVTANLLAGCYCHALKLAVTRGLKSIAFPAISTGIYGCPMAEASRSRSHSVGGVDRLPWNRCIVALCPAKGTILRKELFQHTQCYLHSAPCCFVLAIPFVGSHQTIAKITDAFND